MKITGIETFVVDAGWRPWQFVAVRTDAGLTGYGECSDGRNPYGVVGAVRDFEPILLGQDPRPVERIYWDLYRMARQSPGGIAAKAIAGIELALWDVKAKALGVPVCELFGGPLRAPPARLLVPLRHLAGHERRDDRRAAPPHDGRRPPAGRGGRPPRLPGAQDQHRLSGRSGAGPLPGVRRRARHRPTRR